IQSPLEIFVDQVPTLPAPRVPRGCLQRWANFLSGLRPYSAARTLYSALESEVGKVYAPLYGTRCRRRASTTSLESFRNPVSRSQRFISDGARRQFPWRRVGNDRTPVNSWKKNGTA